jgi:hypothetical protein
MNRPFPPGDEPPHGGEDFYKKHYPRLVELAIEECKIERTAAEALAHAVVMSVLPKSGRVTDPATWLDAAMRAACAHIQKKGGQD